MMPERNWLRHSASYRAAFMPPKVSFTCALARERRTTSWPEYISST